MLARIASSAQQIDLTEYTAPRHPSVLHADPRADSWIQHGPSPQRHISALTYLLGVWQPQVGHDVDELLLRLRQPQVVLLFLAHCAAGSPCRRSTAGASAGRPTSLTCVRSAKPRAFASCTFVSCTFLKGLSLHTFVVMRGVHGGAIRQAEQPAVHAVIQPLRRAVLNCAQRS